MKKRIFPFVQIILMLILTSIPAVMVFFYRSEFENYEIVEIDSHLTVIQNHARLFCEKYGEDESRFIKEMSSYMSQHSEFGSMIILDEGYEIVLPEDQPSREARGALAEEFAGAIQQGTLQNLSYFDTEDGLSLRVSFSSLQGKDAGKLYIIAYYDTDKSSSQIDRLDGFRRAMKACGIPESGVRIVPGDTVEEALAEGRIGELLFPMDYTAIISFRDEVSYPVMLALGERGVAIPDDVSIVSFDHLRGEIPYLPRLTSIYADNDNVAAQGVRLLLNRIGSRDLPPQITVLPVRLYDEGTTAPPKA